MWWNIIKSSRDEAYSKFLEEFGPGVDLKSLELDNPEPHLIQLLGDEWHINLEAGEISFHSMTLGHEAFVEGIFKEEYPERYQEIVDMLKEASSRRERLRREAEGRFFRPYDPPTYENIINLIEKKIRDLGLLDDTDYATVHDMPFTAVLEMALEELKNVDWPPPGSPLPRTDTRIKMFDAVLDEFIRIYTLLQRNRLTYRDLAERRVTLTYRRRALKRLLDSSFIVAHARIAPREPNSQFLSEVLSIIEVEMNPSGE